MFLQNLRHPSFYEKKLKKLALQNKHLRHPDYNQSFQIRRSLRINTLRQKMELSQSALDMDKPFEVNYDYQIKDWQRELLKQKKNKI
jgi:hypothetical protein